jgi:hypothetical protein
MWVGVSIVFLRVGEKNKINSFKFALTYQRAKSILISILSLSYQVVVVFLHLPLKRVVSSYVNILPLYGQNQILLHHGIIEEKDNW